MGPDDDCQPCHLLVCRRWGIRFDFEVTNHEWSLGCRSGFVIC